MPGHDVSLPSVNGSTLPHPATPCHAAGKYCADGHTFDSCPEHPWSARLLRRTPARAESRGWRTRHLGLLAVVLVLATALAAAGCGGDEESATEQWAGDVCIELSTWVTGVEEAVTSLTANPLSLDKTAVQAATEDVKGATDELVDGLADLGSARDRSRRRGTNELDELGTQLQQQLDEVEQAAESGSLSLVAVTTALAAAASSVTSTFATLQSLDGGEELRDGFEDAEDLRLVPRASRHDRRRVGQLGSAHPHRPARPVGRPRPGRLVGRHDRTARDPGPLRRRGRDARLGADLVQPGARARGSAGGLPRASPPDSGLRRRRRPLRGGIARLRLRAVVRAARRRPRRPGCRRRRGRLRCARAAGRRCGRGRTGRPRLGRSPACSAQRSAPRRAVS